MFVAHKIQLPTLSLSRSFSKDKSDPGRTELDQSSNTVESSIMEGAMLEQNISNEAERLHNDNSRAFDKLIELAVELSITCLIIINHTK